jgi:hypothetical protein
MSQTTLDGQELPPPRPCRISFELWFNAREEMRRVKKRLNAYHRIGLITKPHVLYERNGRVAVLFNYFRTEDRESIARFIEMQIRTGVKVE